MPYVLKSIFTASLVGTALAVIITLIRPVTKKVFGGGWHYYIWLVALLAMVLPGRLFVPVTKTAGVPTVSLVQVQTLPGGQNPGAYRDIVTSAGDIAVPVGNGARSLAEFFESRADLLVGIWLLGLAVVLLVNAIGYLRLIRRIHQKSVVVSLPEVQKYTKRPITVRVCGGLSAPFIMGVARPVLVLPDKDLTPEQLDNILLHEMTHFKRRDLLYKWFAALVKAVHWFNPFSYYIAKQINTECEISCDLSVVKGMDADRKMSYVNTIISLLAVGKGRSIPLTTGMTGNKNTLKKRFSMIKNKKTTGRFAAVLSVIVTAVMLMSTVWAGGVLSGISISEYKSDAEIEEIPFEKLPESPNVSVPEVTPTEPEAVSLTQTEADMFTENIPFKGEEPQNPGGLNERYEFSGIADAEQYLKSGGITKEIGRNFRSGENYIVNDYNFEDSSVTGVPGIAANEDGEVSIYLNGNMDSLVSVKFRDAETGDEVNSAVILTGSQRIYKFTGLDPSRRYDVEFGDMTQGEWQIKGQYIIF